MTGSHEDHKALRRTEFIRNLELRELELLAALPRIPLEFKNAIFGEHLQAWLRERSLLLL